MWLSVYTSIVETCEFSEVPSLSMGVHGTLMYLNLIFIN